MDIFIVYYSLITYQCLCEWPSLIELYLDNPIYLSLNIWGLSPLRSSPGRIVPIGYLKANPSNNNMGELCFALFRLPNSLGSGGGAFFCMDAVTMKSSGGWVCPGRVAWSVRWLWVERCALLLPPLWDLPTPWTRGRGVCRGQWGCQGKKKVSGTVSRHWRDSPLEWLQQLPWQPLRRMLEATGSSSENVLPFLISDYIWHSWPDSFLRLFLPLLIWHEPSYFCALPWVTFVSLFCRLLLYSIFIHSLTMVIKSLVLEPLSSFSSLFWGIPPFLVWATSCPEKIQLRFSKGKEEAGVCWLVECLLCTLQVLVQCAYRASVLPYNNTARKVCHHPLSFYTLVPLVWNSFSSSLLSSSKFLLLFKTQVYDHFLYDISLNSPGPVNLLWIPWH